MKKNSATLKTILLVSLVVTVSGCDFLRSLVGRPTSAEIAEKKNRMEMENRIAKAREDSIALANRPVADVSAYVDSIRKCGVSIVPAQRISHTLARELKFGYCIVIGTFVEPENAENLTLRAKNAGYEVLKYPYRNGNASVFVNPSDDVSAVYRALKKVLKEDFCPPDAWVLAKK